MKKIVGFLLGIVLMCQFVCAMNFDGNPNDFEKIEVVENEPFLPQDNYGSINVTGDEIEHGFVDVVISENGENTELQNLFDESLKDVVDFYDIRLDRSSSPVVVFVPVIGAKVFSDKIFLDKLIDFLKKDISGFLKENNSYKFVLQYKKKKLVITMANDVENVVKFFKRRWRRKKCFNRICFCGFIIIAGVLCVVTVFVLAGWGIELPCTTRFAPKKLSKYCQKLCDFYKNHPSFCKNGTTNSTVSGLW